MKKKIILPVLLLLFAQHAANAFCGFYVARAEATLFNKTSQVILVRNGDRSTITMSSDFRGNVSDFAMVIPVPTVLSRSDIKVVERKIFDQFDAYSGPRLVEYFDQNPCQQYQYDNIVAASAVRKESTQAEMEEKSNKDSYKVAVVARYTVGEYDIQILNAQESGGLERWLNDHGYKIPEGAREVLEPYIKSNMKFFVVKVNLEEQQRLTSQILRPLQISFNSPKFMLPIRLGMANGDGNQDMIIYAFTPNGRIESTNYRTLKMPSDRNVPTFVKDYFGKFYTDLYKENIRKEGTNNLFLEYAWDISGQNAVKCDPCPSQPPLYNEITEAGVNWLQTGGWGGYTGQLFFTRLHVTYNRNDFPQDLIFQETPNRENYQCRYILNHPAPYTNDCTQWNNYQEQKIQSRKKELRELAYLTGWDVSRYRDYPSYFQGYRAPQPPDSRTGYFTPAVPEPTHQGDKTGMNVPPQKHGNVSTYPIAMRAEIKIQDTLAAIQQTDFVMEAGDQKKQGKNFTFEMLALAAVTGLFLIHRIKS